MRNIQPANIAYDQILENYLVDEIGDSFDKHRALLKCCELDYNAKSSNPIRLHEIPESGNLYRSMVSYYEKEFVGGCLRHFYDKIRAHASKCPHCGSNKVTCLDHFLPKEKFNNFAILPINLVPSCKDCNEAKGTYSANKYEDLLIHPYFENFNNRTWIGCRVISRNPIAVEFFVINDPNDPILSKRVTNHFDKLKLGKLYEINAADDIVGIHLELHNLFVTAGKEGVVENLRERSNSWANPYPNSWQAALYRGLSEDDWYCETHVATLEP